MKASLANDSSFTIIYSPRGEPFSVDKTLLAPAKLREIWFDPRYGVEHVIHTSATKGIQSYTPPSNVRGNDWVLIIEKVE